LVTDECYGTLIFAKSMEHSKGKRFKVLSISWNNRYQLDGCSWYNYTPDMLEKIPQSKPLEVVIDGVKYIKEETIC
jgi:hypothetical protein